MYLNKAYLIGNLTRDPELKALPSGGAVCTLSMATNRVWKDKNGTRQESADFHNIVVFGNQGKSCHEYLRKGNQLLVEGRMQTRSWEGPDGSKRYRTEIIADRVQFGPKPTSYNAPGGGRDSQDDISIESEGEPTATEKTNRRNGHAAVVPKGQKTQEDQIEYPDEEIDPESIPF